jgi:hypothetical protein
VNLLAARPKRVQRVVTVCTPYTLVPERYNRLLHHSSEDVLQSLASMQSQTKARILSVHAAVDQLVPPAASKPAGIAHRRLWSILHGPTIFAALVLYRRTLKAFLLS